MRDASLSFLTSLLETPSPSGHEHAGQKRWLDYVRPFATRVWNDAYGNCFASLEPQGYDPAKTLTVAVCGHADEIGLMVNHIDDKGFVYCRAIGGIDVTSIVGKRLRFKSSVPGVGEVFGVIGATAIHLQDKSGDPKIRKLHELFIDIGATDGDSAKKRLNIGDPGVFCDSFQRLTDDVIIARALDNRIGTFAAAETLRLCHEKKPELAVRVVAVSTVQEEIGLHGAAMIAHSLRPNVCLVTDVGHATDSPGISPQQHGLFKLGGGPKIAIGAEMHPDVVARLLRAAERQTITVQRSATPGSSGTDTDAIFLMRGGIPCGLLSLPLRYMHTTVEMASLKDLRQISEVFAGFCLELRPNDSFVPAL
ncbi:MAG: M20/M25/M40 family metallo-hydrolase [Phycisphaerae bacterium]|nr:M20/M25/M40 family metallo-hydrolase [Phycisphaerae bacterium]